MPSGVNSAQVVIRRERSLWGSLLPWAVLIDDQKVGTVANGGTLVIDAAPGDHTIVVRPPTIPPGTGRSKPFSFTAVAAGRIDLVIHQPVMGRPQIQRSDGSLSPVAPGETIAPPSTPPTRATSMAIEGPRYEVQLGGETRTVDNSKSGSSTMRVVRLTREWAKTCTVDVEHITTVHASAGLGIHVLDLKAEAERTLSKMYSTTTEERETFAEEVTLNIAPHTKSTIVFSWKEIRQKGVVQIVEAGFEVRIPYEVVVGLTFDQQQIDAP